MALTYTQNTILFSNIPDGGLTKINYKPTFNDFKYAEYGVTPFINMVEANWNGAQLKNGSTVKATLNTTGEMLSILQTAYNFATSVADEKYAAKSHQHSQYADRDHNHASYYAPISHASTATKYGVGTDANYGHLKISGAYTTKTSADTALSLEGAHNLYTAFVTRISELTAEIATLNSRVATLEGHHTTKPVTLVDVDQSEYTFYGRGQTVKLTYSITPEDATNKSVSWSSSNETYVSVDSEGVVRYDALTTDVDNGYVIITATANDGSGKYDQCKVYVEEARITGMHVNTSTIEAEYAYNGTISAITVTQDINHGDGAVFNEGFTYTYTGRSVTVDSNTGVITILSTGTSYVNITSNADNTKSVQVTVNIIKGTNTITIKEGNNTVGDTLTKSYSTSPIKLTATTKSGATVTWRSSNTSVATISGDGTITLKDAGTTTITATVDSSELYKSATKTITLNVTSVTKYYWYAGQTNPANNSTITSTVGTQGWRLISNPNTVSQSNPLFDTTTGSANAIVGTSSNYWFIALPADKSYKIYDSDYVDQIALGNFKKQSSTVSFNGVNYNVYKGVGTARKWWGYTIY